MGRGTRVQTAGNAAARLSDISRPIASRIDRIGPASIHLVCFEEQRITLDLIGFVSICHWIGFGTL